MSAGGIQFQLASDGSGESRSRYLNETRGRLEPFLSQFCSPIEINRIILAVEEAVVNIFQHGYAQSENAGSVSVEAIHSGPGEIQIIIEDHAPLYDPTRHELPDPEERLEEGAAGGYGIYLIRTIMQLRHEVAENGGNRLILTKQVNQS